MKQHDEKIYRKPSGKPTLEALKSQLIRCREDYARMSSKELASDLRRALKIKIADLEAQIAEANRANAAAAAARSEDEDVGSAPPAEHQAAAARRSAGSRAIPPRFRAIRS